MGAGQELPSPPASPEPYEYVDCEDSNIVDMSYGAPPSPVSSDSDDESTCSSDEGSLTSSVLTIDDLDEDDFVLEDDLPQEEPKPVVYDTEEPKMLFTPQDFAAPYSGPVAEPPCQPFTGSIPIQAGCVPKFSHFPLLDFINRWAQPTMQHHPVPFHHHGAFFANA